MINYANYYLTLIGLGMIIISLFLIFSDKLKGEGLYFDLYVKEQEIRKAIAEADEVIDELKYTSEALIDEVDHNITVLKKFLDDVKVIKENELNKGAIDEQKSKLGIDENHTNAKANLVYEYYNKGIEIAEIAKLLGIGKGEVSLILSLYNGDAKDGDV